MYQMEYGRAETNSMSKARAMNHQPLKLLNYNRASCSKSVAACRIRSPLNLGLSSADLRNQTTPGEPFSEAMGCEKCLTE